MNENNHPDQVQQPQGMEFPAEVDIKVFGLAGDHLEPLVRKILAHHLTAGQLIDVLVRESSRGKYHSLSCKVVAHNREELDRVFVGLSSHPDIAMVI